MSETIRATRPEPPPHVSAAANGFGWLTIYIVAPIIGGLLGGGIYRLFFRVAYRS